MRLARVIAVVCLLTSPALAGTVTETIAFNGSPQYYGDTVSGALFNPALGTLTGVTMTAAGSYTPDIFVGATVPTASLLYVDLTTYGAGGGLTTVPAGAFTLTQNGGFLTGNAEAFIETASVTNQAALSHYYTAFGPDRSNSLLSLDVFSKPATAGAWGSADDLSPYSGYLTVTYAYAAVPEPASMMLLGCAGLLTVLLARQGWRRRASGR